MAAMLITQFEGRCQITYVGRLSPGDEIMSDIVDDEPKIPHALFSCFAQAGGAIVHQKYQHALSILEEGLKQNYQPAEIDGIELLENVRAVVGVLEYNLRQAYGVDWEKKIGVPKIPDEAVRCSFCGKTYAEVAKLITGAEGNICNECISVCNEVLC